MPPLLEGDSKTKPEPSTPLPVPNLRFFNGTGGFTPDGREYVIQLEAGAQTPAPWVNIIANPHFGALVSESGPGFLWCGNSQTNRQIPWLNDPISLAVAEGIYLRDEESGIVWSPTPLPVRDTDTAYQARHGQGYTLFEHNSHGVEQQLTTFVPVDGKPLRVQCLRLRNASARRRRLSVTSYAEWTLGIDREETQPHIVTSWDSASHTLLARNNYHPEFSKKVAFAALSPPAESFTSDRSEFLGRNGSSLRPAALERQHLAGRTGAGLDPCAALQVQIQLVPGETAEVFCLLGQADELGEVRSLVEQFRNPRVAQQSLADTKNWWDELLGGIQVQTPDLAVDFLLNRWLIYQTLSCRIWARSAFYQSGGAFGFRDQLQDVMALVYAAPDLAREHILRASSRQFVEGDVQHWWHPPSGAGIRSRCSDDLLWLPYATAHYVRTTGDTSILEVRIPFLEGRPLEQHEHEAYFVPTPAMEDGSLFEHCWRAIRKGSTQGPHGLPLIGSCDWNDGMNRVGTEGKGESVWLAWFLLDVLKGFIPICELVGQVPPLDFCQQRIEELAEAVEAHGWDGEWYRRAYFDDGTPLGSKDSQEAIIDSLPQSWAVISGMGD
ncbi:MAG TPA: glycosyl transferase, partial [Terriglobia bacterium]|nr:glycosyl transferase [Terriglobia bacterium]